MPVERRKHARVAEGHDDLKAILVDELVKNSPEGAPDDPYIVIEEIPLSDSLHVAVVWDRWQGVDPEERGRVILEAFGEAMGETEMLRVTMAMGLTREEAERLNITRGSDD